MYERQLQELRELKLDRFLELTFQDPPEVLPSSYGRKRPLEPAIVEDQSTEPRIFKLKPVRVPEL
jgi:hypothetical protein